MSMTSDVPSRAAGVGSQTILVVEDSPELRQLFGWTLRNAGYNVEIAEDAIGAVSIARQVRPDLVVLDLGLPGGSGTSVLERLRNLSATALVDVIVITGAMPDYDRNEELAALGCDTVLLKPVAREELLSAISDKLNSVPGQVR